MNPMIMFIEKILRQSLILTFFVFFLQKRKPAHKKKTKKNILV